MAEKKKLLIFDFNGTLERGGRLYPGVEKMLKELHESDEYTMVILSMGHKSSIYKTLEAESERLFPKGQVDLRHYFSNVYGVDEINEFNNGLPDKTNPKVLAGIIEDLSYQGIEIDPQESTIVGDSFAEHLLAMRTGTMGTGTRRPGIGFIYAGWHDVANGSAAKSGLDEVPPTPDSGHVAITDRDIALVNVVDDVAALPDAIKDLNKERATALHAPGNKPDKDHSPGC